MTDHNSVNKGPKMTHGVCLQTVFLGLVLFAKVQWGTSEMCERKTLCSCQLESGAIINLGQIARTDGRPHFRNQDSKGNIYEFNPCHDFQDKKSEDVCKNVAICRQDKATGKYEVLGRNGNMQFEYDQKRKEVYLQYQVQSE